MGGGHRTFPLRLSGQKFKLGWGHCTNFENNWGGDTAQLLRCGWVSCGAYVSGGSVAEPMCWVGGLVKSDFRTHSGSHQSTAWIQNPSSSRVWQLLQV